jgi:mitogen-activated protein kinase
MSVDQESQFHRRDHRRNTNTTFTEDGANFSVDSRYQIQAVLGKGSYGTVCSAVDTKTSHTKESKVAIKKISRIFDREILMKRAVRELKLMRHLKGHKNVIITKIKL